jgi:hypothetical protein
MHLQGQAWDDGHHRHGHDAQQLAFFGSEQS